MLVLPGVMRGYQKVWQHISVACTEERHLASMITATKLLRLNELSCFCVDKVKFHLS